MKWPTWMIPLIFLAYGLAVVLLSCAAILILPWLWLTHKIRYRWFR